MDIGASERAKRRVSWQGRTCSVAESDDPNQSCLSITERFQALREVSLRAYTLSRLPWPTYTRATMPGRCCTLAEDD
jgi:hypothetical protein